ncbi:MAG: methyltransferase [Myxococcaceae bacterium]|nr:methyltransferase [Myxococcaceae bacterium]
MKTWEARHNVLRETWGAVKDALPAPIRKGLRSMAKRTHRTRLKGPAALDRAMAEAERAFAQSDDAGRAYVSSLEMVPDITFPSDPLSPEYREAQFALYRQISGRSEYTVRNELSAPDLELGKVQPFPYSTSNPEIVGDQLIAQGFLIKALGVPPPARLVEFGPGWGHTTHHFLQLGYSVTAVEVDPTFARLIEHRNRDFAQSLTVVERDMLAFESTQPFDAAIFFESFHHCADHLRMMDKLNSLLTTQGTIIFGAEPICDLPYPWGIRLDGLSLWSMRRYGWLELGFEPSYFFSMLRSKGWEGHRQRSQSISTLTDVIVARRRG